MSSLIHKFRLWKATLLLGSRASILKQFESTKIQLVALQEKIQGEKAQLQAAAHEEKAKLDAITAAHVARGTARYNARVALDAEHASAARTVERLNDILGG